MSKYTGSSLCCAFLPVPAERPMSKRVVLLENKASFCLEAGLLSAERAFVCASLFPAT